MSPVLSVVFEISFTVVTLSCATNVLRFLDYCYSTVIIRLKSEGGRMDRLDKSLSSLFSSGLKRMNSLSYVLSRQPKYTGEQGVEFEDLENLADCSRLARKDRIIFRISATV